MTLSALIAGLAGNYAGDTLPCRLRKSMQSSYVVKQLIVVAIVYFAQASMGGKNVWRQTLLLYALFLAWSRCELAFAAGVIVLFVVHDTLQRQEAGPSMRLASDAAFLAAMATLAVGCVLFLVRQRREHGPDFVWDKYVFGTPC